MVYNIGEYIRIKRKELGISQEKLSADICTQATLSRIEMGEHMPRKEVLMAILQRLGLSGAEIMFADIGENFLLHQLKFDIRQAYILGNIEKTQKIIRENEKWISNLQPINRQTFETMSVLARIEKQELTDEEALSQLEAILKLTCPNYKKENPPDFLTYEEILLLNNIALQYAHLGDKETAINLFYHIKNYYDKRVCDIEEALRTQPMVLYNLSKYLGQSQRYAECISVCEEGIKLAVQTGRCTSLSQTYYNLAWSLYHRNKPGDRETSLYYMKLAYYSAYAMMNETSIEKYSKIIFDWYGVMI